ncbi:MAG: hypothetical protein JWM87_3106 [Candidatus Eremiobacteraeota bacterium]|nr:hypothetical protein [Candidatus Eremiobacteraeota bacterium]
MAQGASDAMTTNAPVRPDLHHTHASPESELQRIKEPATPLAGPYGHPFHPIAVTIPIGAWAASLLFDLASLRSDEPRVFARGSAELLKTGLAGGAVASFLGFLDYLKIPKNSKAGVTATTHLALNVTTMGLYLLNLTQREKRLHADASRNDAVSQNEIGLSLLALTLLGASGWLGGMLAYHFGVRVADERTQAEGLHRV